MKVAQVTGAFFSSFQSFFPELKVITDKSPKEKFDLIIFTGGEDISPDLYGQSNTHSSFNKERDNIERKVLELYYGSGTKFFGACRGHQLLNVLMGGRLAQDIYFELGTHHPGTHGFDYADPILPTVVNSMHHQGVIGLGNSIKILATYGGVIEATVSSNNKVFSVQWHPEFMGDTKFFELVKSWVEGNTSLGTLQGLNYGTYADYFERIMNKFRKENGDPEYNSPPRSSPRLAQLRTEAPAVDRYTYTTLSSTDSEPEIQSSSSISEESRERIESIRSQYYTWVREQQSNNPIANSL